jgi:ABC-type transport system substrate-binding protein
MNTERPALADPRVRRAIALSINRLEIAKLFYSNAIVFAASYLLAPMLGRGNDGLTYDPAQARALLATPGVRKPDHLSLLLIFAPRPYLPSPQRVGDHIAAQLETLGIKVDVIPTTVKQYFDTVQRGDYDLAVSGRLTDTLDPVDFLEAVLGSASIPVPQRQSVVGNNLSRWNDPLTDELLDRLRQKPDEDLRTALLRRVADEVPLLPLLYGATIYAHSARVKNIAPNPFGMPFVADFDMQD